MKNTPQPRVDSAHQRTLQETLYMPTVRWGSDPGITQYLKTPLSSDHLHVQTNFSIKDDNETEKPPQTKALTKRCLRRETNIVIIFIVLGRLCCWFAVIPWCHNWPSCILYYVQLAYNFGTFVCRELLLFFRLNIVCMVLLMCCKTAVSLEFPTTYQFFCFVPLASRVHEKVPCLFCILCV